MPGLYPPFAQRPFSDDDEVGRVAQRDLCDRVGFDDLQGSKFLPLTYWMLSGKAQAKTTPPVPVTTYWRLSSS